MKYAVIIRPEAENDLAEAFSWYEEQRRGLGHDFLLQVDAGLRFLERNPESHPPEYQETRKHLIKKFPYKIIYLVKDGKITVLAFFHAKRNPKTLKKRSV